MSKKEDDITRIEDLPEIDRSQEEETEFTDLEQMAKDLGLGEVLIGDQSSSPPDLPNLDSGFEDENAFEENHFEQAFPSDLESDENDDFEDDNSSYLSDEGEFEDNDENDFGENNFDLDANTLEEESSRESTDIFNISDFDEQESLLPEKNEDIQQEENYSQSLDLNAPPSNDYIESDFQTSSSSSEIIDNLIDSNDEPDISHSTDEIMSHHDSVENNETYEDFQEVTNFANEAHNSEYLAEGNPPFSIILKDIIYKEDADAIVETLQEHGLCPNDQKERIQDTINKGQYLIPRLSEYMAIKLCHKFRSLEVDILMGLTEEVSPPKSYSSNDRGLINKRTIKNNKNYTLKNIKDLESTSILATTMSHLDGHIIREYLGVCTLKRTMQFNTQNDRFREEEIYQTLKPESKSRLELLRLKRENLLASRSKRIWDDDLETEQTSKMHQEDIYQIMIEEMKGKALEQKANALIGINFTISPITIERLIDEGPRYEIIGTASLAWVERSA